jgi:GDP-mannose 6-dehydrogenase
VKVVVVGLGYVGSVTAACLAELGHTVTGVDVDASKVATLESGQSPIVEPRLEELIAAATGAGRLRATTAIGEAVASADVVLVCVGTPARSDGTVDLGFVERAASGIGQALAGHDGFPVVVFRSTAPPGTVSSLLAPTLERTSGRRVGQDFGVAMVPEFLREGSGVDDFFDPPFTVVGSADERSHARVVELFDALGRPLHGVGIETAESLKYASNAFHAAKVSFTNEVARLLAAVGVDARDVMELFCRDDKLNVSTAYLRPGFAFGGSCLPKDLRALLHVARLHDVDVPLLHGVLRSNDAHVQRAVRTVLDSGARDVALLGLSFKAETDDLRESPYVELAETLIGKGLRVRIFDPIVNPSRLIGTNRRYVETHLPHLSDLLVTRPEDALGAAQIAVIATASPVVRDALLASPPARVVDLHGRLGPEIEALAGYEGLAW